MIKVTFLFVVLLVGLLSSIVWADCVDLSVSTSWARLDSHKIIVYRGSTAIALLEIPYCFIYSTSEIKLVKDYVCNWDKIIIDGDVCDITKVERL